MSETTTSTKGNRRGWLFWLVALASLGLIAGAIFQGREKFLADYHYHKLVTVHRNEQRRAAIELTKLGKPGIKALIRLFGDNSNHLARVEAINALGSMGPLVVPELILVLENDDKGIKSCAIRALGKIGPDAEEAIPHIALWLGESGAGISEAKTALVNIGPASIPILVQSLKSDSICIRINACYALQDFGVNAKAAVPYLMKLINKTKPTQQPSPTLFNTLVSIGPDSVPSLIICLGHKNPYIEIEAARALGTLGPISKPAVKPLIKHLDRIYGNNFAYQAITKIGPVAIPVLNQELPNASPKGMKDIKRLIAELGASASD